MANEQTQTSVQQQEIYLQGLFLKMLASPEAQSLLRDNAFQALVDFSQDVHKMILALSTVSSAQFVMEHIPLHLATSHEELRSQAVAKADAEGLFLEFGVFQGGWINFMAAERSVQFYGFDSFEGIPESWSTRPAGRFDLKGNLPCVLPNVMLIKGWFKDTLPVFLAEHPEPVSFVHVDCDLYSSTATVLEHLAPRLRAGTQIVLDDFMLEPGWETAEHKAFFDFVRSRGIEFEYTGYSGCSAGVVLTRVGDGAKAA